MSGAAPPLVFREPYLPTGFPDVVAVFCDEQLHGPTPARLSLGQDHLRLLHHLHTVRQRSVMEVAGALGRSERQLRALLEDLERALLAHCHRDRAIVKPLGTAFIAKRIVAVEAKIRDWQGALRQAVANTWFASHSYVLMPAGRLGHSLLQRAAQLGIGVMSYDGTRIAVALRPRRLHIPSSYGSWLVNEWTVRQVSHHPH